MNSKSQPTKEESAENEHKRMSNRTRGRCYLCGNDYLQEHSFFGLNPQEQGALWVFERKHNCSYAGLDRAPVWKEFKQRFGKHNMKIQSSSHQACPLHALTPETTPCTCVITTDENLKQWGFTRCGHFKVHELVKVMPDGHEVRVREAFCCKDSTAVIKKFHYDAKVYIIHNSITTEAASTLFTQESFVHKRFFWVGPLSVRYLSSYKTFGFSKHTRKNKQILENGKLILGNRHPKKNPLTASLFNL